MAISPLTPPKTKYPPLRDKSRRREEYQEQFEARSEDGLRVSEEIYWRDYYEHPDCNYEWNNGLLEEKPVSDFSNGTLYLWFIDLLRQYLRVHPIAEITILDLGFRLEQPDGKVSIRKPDLGIILNDNQVGIEDSERTYQGIFDICIESLSDSSLKEKERDTKQKKQEYETIGVREYYILDGKSKETAFYRQNEAGEYEDMVDSDRDLFQSEVLPGFQFRISDLYKRPPPLEMVEDELYQDFIMTEYQAAREQTEQEKERAEQEKERAERVTVELKQEKERADQEKERADKMTAKLKALGISLD